MNISGEIINNTYKIIEKIDENFISDLWDVQIIPNNKNAILQIIKKQNNHFRHEDLIRFKNETISILKLNHPNIVKIYETGVYKNHTYIITEPIKGVLLSRYLSEHKTIDIDSVLTIIDEILNVLQVVHQEGIIHRNLFPGNIWLSLKNNNIDKVKLFGFGTIELIETSKIYDLNYNAPTLCYMSPESNKIINVKCDERSDLYSLGIIFFRLLTGELPFPDEDINSFLYKQITLSPRSPLNIKKEVPQELDRIILKLLEKDQENRYQTAKGLAADLRMIKNNEKNFEPGTQDKRQKINFNTDFIGRVKELNFINSLMSKAARSHGCICLISGEAGCGKTRLAEEIKKYVFNENWTWLPGKCPPDKDSMPYQVFYNIFNEHLDFYYKLNEEYKNEIIKNINVNVGDLGEEILKLNPSMKDILGDVKPLIMLDSKKEKERFLDVSSNFFCSLGKIDSPLVLFLDDLQWADEGSLSLISEIAYKISEYPLFILLAYRDSEIHENHTINQLMSNHHDIKNIKINNLNVPELNQFTAGILNEKEHNIPVNLTKYIFTTSTGNPFLTIEIIKQLLEKNVITEGSGNWDFNIDKINDIKVYATFVDTILRRINLFTTEEKKLLSLGSIIGSKFELEILYKLSKLNTENILRIINKAIELQILETDPFEKGCFLFVHNKVQETFYKKVNDLEKKIIHLDIAEIIEEMNLNSEKKTFRLTHHYNKSGNHIKSIEHARPAGDIAKEKHAYSEAIKYYKLALKSIEDNNIKGSESEIRILKSLSEIYLTIGNYDKAIDILNKILPKMPTDIEKSYIYKLVCQAYFKKGDWKRCEEFGAIGLRLLGEKLPLKKFSVVSGLFKEFLIHTFKSITRKIIFYRTRVQENDKYKLAIEFYYSLVWSYILNDQWKMVRAVLRALNLKENKSKNTRESAMSMTAYASLCMAMPLFKRSIKHHEKALKIRKNIDDKWGIAQSYQFMGYCYQWMGEYKKSIDNFLTAVDLFNKIGDTREAGISYNGLSQCYYYLSDYNKANSVSDKYSNIANKTKDNFAIVSSLMQVTQYYYEIGDYKNAEYYSLKAYNLSYKNKIWMSYCLANLFLGIIFLEKGNIKKSDEFLQKARDLHEKYNFLRHYTVHLYTALAEKDIAEYKSGHNLKKKTKKILLKKTKKSCRTALIKTRPWITNYIMALRVNANYNALLGRNKKAEKYFLKSIGIANKIGRKYELAKSFYEYGLFHNELKNHESSRLNLQQAYLIFKQINSRSYSKQITNLLDITEFEDSSKDRALDKKRLSSIILIGQQISSILNIEGLLENIVTNALEVTGALRGYLFIANEENNELELRASKSMEEKIIEQYDFQYSNEIINDVYISGKVIISHDASKDSSLLKYNLPSNHLKSILAIPINLHKKRIGAFYLDNRFSGSVFSKDDIELLNVFLSQAAISIENANLYSNLEKKVKERTLQLRDTQDQLLETAHEAGMAEIAISILHNIGNILNSINISSEEIIDIITNSKISGFLKANQMLKQNEDDINNFIINNKKGKLLPEYYLKIGEVLNNEHLKLETEINQLVNKIKMIIEVISEQKNYTRKNILKF